MHSAAPPQQGGKRLLADFPIDSWADAQVSQWRLCTKSAVVEVFWESWNLAGSEVLAANGSYVFVSFLCLVLVGWISVFSVIKEKKQWIYAVQNRVKLNLHDFVDFNLNEPIRVYF